MTQYDAIIVGSGPTGGFAAKRLCESGLRVCVLEAGPGAAKTSIRSWYQRTRRRLGYRIEEDPAAIRRQRVQAHCYAWPIDPDAFIDDVNNPYMTEAEAPFKWIRCRRLGGRMTVRRHGLQFYRLSDLDLTAGNRDGASDSWPLSYRDLAPYYEHVERWMRLRGSTDRLRQLPDSTLAGSVELNAGLRVLDVALRRKWPGRCVIPGRTATPPVPIRDAIRTGKCRVVTGAIAAHIVTDPSTGKATAVRFVDRQTHRTREISGRVVVLCASSIESARLMLNSATRQHPAGLGNSSELVGRYLTDHVHLERIDADMPLQVRRPDQEQSITAGYIPRFRNLSRPDTSFVRGYGVQVFTEGDRCGFIVFGEMLPHRDNRVTLDPSLTDAWGVPAVRLECRHRVNEIAMMRDAADQCREMLEAAGFKLWRMNTEPSVPGLACHEVGTARMGTDPKSSVLNTFCQSWDVKNLFVMDGSCFVTQGVQNPTLTMMALAARSCDYLLDSLKRGDL